MEKYNLSMLNDTEFEELCCDILELETGNKFRTFKKGKDGGIDIMPINGDTSVIGQAKHLINTPFSTGKSELIKSNERQKIERANVKKYYFFTSRELTEKNLLDLQEIFTPYLKHENIYDYTIINKILNTKQAEYIIDKWEKLWLPSQNIINKIVKNYQDSKYSYTKNQIIRDCKYYVKIASYNKARDVLKDNNVLIIHGEPGVGKTSMAKSLCNSYIKNNYQFIFGNVNNIKEIEQEIYSDGKKVILIDDFLGSNIMEMNVNTTDNLLENIIDLCLNSKDKKLILTTRTYIYNNAKETMEKFNLKIDNVEKMMLNVSDCSNLEKAKILYNHLYFNQIYKNEIYEEIKKNQFYNKIIEHQNFNPRTISQIAEKINQEEPKNIQNYIIAALNNPYKIWNNEYEKLSEEQKTLLILICIAGNVRNEENIINVFNKMIENNNNDNLYKNTIKKLSEAFIKVMHRGKTTILSPLNPSVTDFIIYKIRQNEINIEKYIKNSLHISQLEFILKIDSKYKKLILEKLIDEIDYFDSKNPEREKNIYFLLKEMDFKEDEYFKKLIDKAYTRKKIWWNYDLIMHVLYEKSEMYEFVKEKIYEDITNETFYLLNEIKSVKDMNIYNEVVNELQRTDGSINLKLTKNTDLYDEIRTKVINRKFKKIEKDREKAKGNKLIANDGENIAGNQNEKIESKRVLFDEFIKQDINEFDEIRKIFER